MSKTCCDLCFGGNFKGCHCLNLLCRCHPPEPSKDLEGLINELIRDITKVGFMSKGEARQRIEQIYSLGVSSERQRLRGVVGKKGESSVWLLGSYGQPRLNRATYINGYKEALNDILELLNKEMI